MALPKKFKFEHHAAEYGGGVCELVNGRYATIWDHGFYDEPRCVESVQRSVNGGFWIITEDLSLKEPFKFKLGDALAAHTVVYTAVEKQDCYYITWKPAYPGDPGCTRYIKSQVEDFLAAGIWVKLSDEPQEPVLKFTHRAHPDTKNKATRQKDGYWLVSWGDRGNGVKNSCFYNVEQVRHFIASGEWNVVSVSIDGEGNTRALLERALQDASKLVWPVIEVDDISEYCPTC